MPYRKIGFLPLYMALLLAASLLFVSASALGLWTFSRTTRVLAQGNRLDSLALDIRYQDQILSQTAQLASLAGDGSWTEQYRQSAAALDAAIGQAIQLFPAGSSYLDQVAAANQRLMAAEEQAFKAIAAGQQDKAQAILASTTYQTDKRTYSEGLSRLLEAIARDRDQNRRAMDLQRILLISLISLLFLAVMLLVLQAYRLLNRRLRAENKLNASLYELATTDHLTGLWNRRHFLEQLELVLKSFQRHPVPTGLMMIDLDYFKTINDQYGHAGGDAVLQQFAGVIRTGLREMDILGRLGGEEFAVLMQGSSWPELQKAAERIRLTIEKHPFQWTGRPIHLTISIGLTQLLEGDRTIDQPLGRADQALYRAKNQGRNQVIVNLEPH